MMTEVQGGAGRLFVSDGGQGGVPVVFLHGLGSELETWGPVLDRLRASRRAIAYDQRGHGRSDAASEYSVDALADDLERVVAALGLAKFWLVAHSFSGAVATAYAAGHPEKVAGVVYVDAVGDVSRSPPAVKERFRQHDSGMTPDRLQSAYAEMLGPKAKPATRRAIAASAARMDLKAFAALRGSMGEFDGLSAAKKYTGPRFAIEAEGEPDARLASSLPGTRRAVIPGVSHWLMLDNPAATVRALEEAIR